jgi:hypothetical protein
MMNVASFPMISGALSILRLLVVGTDPHLLGQMPILFVFVLSFLYNFILFSKKISVSHREPVYSYS